jgi:hypothetical protein
MASTVVYSPNTYAGELYGALIRPSIVTAQGLVEKGLVTPLPGIKKRTILRTLDFGVVFQDPSCDFVAQSGNIAPGEKYIDPVKYEVMVEVCYADLRTGWEAAQLKKGSLNDYVPPADFEALLLDIMRDKIALMNEQLYINGKAGVTAGTVSFSAAYPGLIGRLVADSTVLKYTTGSIGSSSTMAITGITVANPGVVTVASTANLRTGDRVTITAISAGGPMTTAGTTIVGKTFTITVLSATTFNIGVQTSGTAVTGATMMFSNASNVLDVLAYIYNNVPQAVSTKPDFKIWVPRQFAQHYQQQQANVASQVAGAYNGEKPLDFLGSKLTVVDALPANTFIAASASNIFLGFDDSGDEDYIRVTDMAKTTGDDKYRYKASMKTDINYLYGNEIVFIAPVIS